MKRFLSLTAIVLVLMIAVIGCQQAPKELKVAVLAPLSGPVPTFGVSTRDGALLAIRRVERQGRRPRHEDHPDRRGQPVHP